MKSTSDIYIKLISGELFHDLNFVKINKHFLI